jgi:hypothetical protein
VIAFMADAYFDLREGDTLRIPESHLELYVTRASGRELQLTSFSIMKVIPPKKGGVIRQVIIYNFGNRKHGRFNHVRITVPDERYGCFRDRGGTTASRFTYTERQGISR